MYRNRCKMCILRFLLLIFISRAVSLEFSMTKNANSYGPYNIKWYDYKLCHGPKSKDVAFCSSTFITDDYGSVASYNSTFITAAKIEEVKIVVWNVNGNQKTALWNYKFNQPCKHFAISGLLERYYRNMHNCVVPQGEYIFKTNYTEVAKMFFGKSFFYGDFSFKVYVLSKQGNVICILINALFSKPNP